MTPAQKRWLRVAEAFGTNRYKPLGLCSAYLEYGGGMAAYNFLSPAAEEAHPEGRGRAWPYGSDNAEPRCLFACLLVAMSDEDRVYTFEDEGAGR